MNAIKRHPLFTAWVALCGVLLIFGLGWLIRLKQSARHELASLAKKQQQRVQLIADAQSAASIKALVLPERRVVAVAPVSEAQGPRKPLDAFIAIAAGQEEMRRLAASEAVALLPDEAFGFAAYAHEGPREKDLVAVLAQLALTRLVVEKLFAAHPEKLFAIRRESLRGGERERGREAADDFFVFDQRGGRGSEGRAVQIEFTGQTPVLRALLNSLASATEPLVVRGVEVEPVRADPKWPGPRSKFSVLVQLANHGGDRAAAGKIATRWTAPRESGDLFNAPDLERSRQKIESVVADNGCELLAVKREPYRLQLVGYFGAPGSFTATFISPGAPETFHAREGQRLASLELTIKSFSLQRSGPGCELTAYAQIWDERKQELVMLFAHELRLTELSLAVLRFGPPPGRSRECRIGDTFLDGAATCRIERIQLEPAEVVIVRERPGQAKPERLFLKPGTPASLKLSSVYPSQ